ncbi:MAG: type VI secretion system-associated FHA domain protein TagH [Methylococcaceae bacterium]|nr:type VI secretion system-associated FHA domain protein TagH [Methylococcaceae bacterium]
MRLILKVLTFKNKPTTEIRAVTIGNDGGSIGRSDDNRLVLPDVEKFVSRHHAVIGFENNGYYLSDTSLSGVYINGADKPLNNATARLDNGTQLKIGEYEIAVAITDDDPIADGFSFTPSPTSRPNMLLAADESWGDLGIADANGLMTDDFPRHDELVQSGADQHPIDFESRLLGNQASIFDNYIAPDIVTSSLLEQIPDNLSFDDFFSESDTEKKVHSPHTQAINTQTVPNDFEDFFDAAISDRAAEVDGSKSCSETPPLEHNNELSQLSGRVASDTLTTKQPLFSNPPGLAAIKSIREIPAGKNHEAEILVDIFADDKSVTEPTISTSVKPSVNYSNVVPSETDVRRDQIKTEPVLATKAVPAKTPPPLENNPLFNAFLQGVGVECKEIQAIQQQAEALHRIGQMFRKLIDGTVAVLRSRTEFKSLCRVNMTVIKAANNNPLKFTVSTDDVLRQLIENKTDGFIASTTAIEEAFNDIMIHQLAMQAGIQASLTDLLKTFDPKIIEKQFEQGLVLQKKSKCWDRYEDTYRNTVEDAVENFFGEAFVKAYEQQMRKLTHTRSK